MRFFASLYISIILSSCGANSNYTRLSHSTQNSDGSFTANISEDDFFDAADPERRGKQEKQNWCWAADAQMILAYHHISVTQQDLVTKLFGRPVDQGADVKQIAFALNGLKAPNGNGALEVNAEAMPFTRPLSASFARASISIVNELTADRPLILGLKNQGGEFSGHGYIVIAADYTKDSKSNVTISRLKLIDPLTGNSTVTYLTGSAAEKRFKGLVTINVTSVR